MDEIFGIFPIPIMRAPGTVPKPLVDGLVAHFSTMAVQDNNSSFNLTHTKMLTPAESPLLVEVAGLVTPKLIEFGLHLFGERMAWALKEMWVNVMDYGGHQAMHNHANSFISAVVYLTPTHESSRTVFMKSPGGVEYSFKNDHEGVVTGPFNAEKWISPPPEPGDVTLFPSYLMHAVPPNAGERRITLAMNAIPARLDSWGYAINFSG
jgi:hypothetical protein